MSAYRPKAAIVLLRPLSPRLAEAVEKLFGGSKFDDFPEPVKIGFQ